MTHSVTFSEQAWRDTDEIYDWIADQSDPGTAERYIGRIIDFCAALSDFPHRGTSRTDLVPGLRTTVFERRTLIAYVVERREVRILRLLHRGRDVSGAFPPQSSSSS